MVQTPSAPLFDPAAALPFDNCGPARGGAPTVQLLEGRSDMLKWRAHVVTAPRAAAGAAPPDPTVLLRWRGGGEQPEAACEGMLCAPGAPSAPNAERPKPFAWRADAAGTRLRSGEDATGRLLRAARGGRACLERACEEEALREARGK